MLLPQPGPPPPTPALLAPGGSVSPQAWLWAGKQEGRPLLGFWMSVKGRAQACDAHRQLAAAGPGPLQHGPRSGPRLALH